MLENGWQQELNEILANGWMKLIVLIMPVLLVICRYLLQFFGKTWLAQKELKVFIHTMSKHKELQSLSANVSSDACRAWDRLINEEIKIKPFWKISSEEKDRINSLTEDKKLLEASFPQYLLQSGNSSLKKIEKSVARWARYQAMYAFFAIICAVLGAIYVLLAAHFLTRKEGPVWLFVLEMSACVVTMIFLTLQELTSIIYSEHIHTLFSATCISIRREKSASKE